MKKFRLMAFSLLCMILLPIHGSAATLKVNGTDYADLNAALTAASDNDTIELYNSSDLGNVTINKTLTIVGKGTTRPKITGYVVVSDGKKVSISDIDFETTSPGTDDASKANISLIGSNTELVLTNSNVKQLTNWFGIQVGYIQNGTATEMKLTLNNVNLEGNYLDTYGIYIKEKGSTVNVNNSTIKVNGGAGYAIDVCGSNHTINVKNSKIETLKYHAIRVFYDGNIVNVTNGSEITAYAPISIAGKSGMVATNTTVTVKDSKINARITDDYSYGGITVEKPATVTLMDIDGATFTTPLVTAALGTNEDVDIYKHGIENRGTITTLNITNSKFDADKEASHAIFNRKDQSATITNLNVTKSYFGANLTNIDKAVVDFNIVSGEEVSTAILDNYSFYADAAMTNLKVVMPENLTVEDVNTNIDNTITNLPEEETKVVIDSRDNVGDNLVVDASVIANLKDKNATLVIVPSDGYTIEIDSADITDETKSLNTKIEQLETLPEGTMDLLKNALKTPNATSAELNEKVVALDFAQEGLFPGKIKVTYKTELNPGDKVSVTYWDETNKKLVFVKNNIVIDENNCFTVELEHASTYLVSLNPLVADPTIKDNPKTFDGIFTYLLIGLGCIAGYVGVGLYLKRRKVNA